jgi:hypothetical protein
MRSLRDEAGRNAYAGAHGWQALQAAWLDVGHLTVDGSKRGDPIEVRLPPEWDR